MGINTRFEVVVHQVVNMLPRMSSEVQFHPMKLKKKMSYKSNYMCNYIRKDVVVAAIKWLKHNNKLYEGIELNDSWAEEWINSQYSSFLSETEYDNVQPDKDELADNNYTTADNINKASQTVSHNQSEISCEQATENREFNEDQNATQVSIQLSGRPTSHILEFEHIENEIYPCAWGKIMYLVTS